MWSTIKQLLQKQGARIIIVEEGEPVGVVIRMDEYNQLLEAEKRLNSEPRIEPIKEEGNQTVRPETKTNEGSADNEIKLENLPF